MIIMDNEEGAEERAGMGPGFDTTGPRAQCMKLPETTLDQRCQRFNASI